MAYHLNFGSAKITLDESYLHTLSSEQKLSLTEESTEKISDKVIQLLDRYEHAASKIEMSRGILNAKEIASRLNPPVTPPAITDAVKKNSRKIEYLLRQFPDRWSLIRSAIRPIQRIDNNGGSMSINVS
jgi:septation ring formation regulator EzrA